MSYTTWSEVAAWASAAGAKYPQLVAAQWALESEWGSAVSGKNNLFGIKGVGTVKSTTEYNKGVEVVVKQEFQDFDSPESCVRYLVDRWYKDYKNYKGVNNATSRNQAAKMLVSEGYATDPKYAEKLISLMDKNTAPSEKSASTEQSLIQLKKAAQHYRALPHQDKAWETLQASLTAQQLADFTKAYRSAPEEPIWMPDVEVRFPLKIPYFYQRDSKTGHGERSCQSSAIAMVIEYLNPNIIKDDDDYLKTVFRYGDTVSQVAHAKALTSLGIKHQFKTNGSKSELIRLLDLGYPVPIGILHKGNIQNPSGGGHWIVVIGYDNDSFHVHDPFGELNLIAGGYSKTGPVDGKSQRYSQSNLMKRWLIHSKNDGWYWDFSENKKP